MKKLPRINSYAEIGALFLIALCIRVVFNLTQESRLCHFGDAFYFLTSGSQLLAAVQSGTLLNLAALQQQATIGVNAMMSHSLVDRILIDGPVFPAYLAFVQFFVGLNPAAPHFDVYSLQIAVCNSIMDAVACVLIYQTARLAFDHRSGRIAGLLAAFYPAAIINTANCYSEPFAYAMVALFLSLLFASQLRHRNGFVTHSLSLLLGVSAGLLMLAKPIFVLLPPLCAILLPLLSRKFHPMRAGVALAGLALTLAPWLMFTGIVTGKSTLVVNRYPAFNFLMGNRTASDGWREYPLASLPLDMKDAIQLVADQAKSQPAEFLGMELRKPIRLWAGSWNNFEKTFVLTPPLQDAYHQLLILLAVFGVSAALSLHPLRSRIGRSALILAAVPIFHCIYLVFEPQSRYAFPAMAALIPLAAFALSSRTFFPKTTAARVILALFGVILAISIAAEFTFKQERWQRALTETQVARTFTAPVVDGYIMVDAVPISSTSVRVNGIELPKPVPLWQLVENEGELIDALSTQSNGMDRPMTDFRQWWAFPVQQALLKDDGNQVEISGGTIYGDIPQAFTGNTAWLPSPRLASWTKAFTTIHRGEPRLYERLALSAQTEGRQVVPRAYFVPAKSPMVPGMIKTIDFHAKTVIGADPTTYALGSVESLDGAGRFRFTATVQSPKTPTNAYAAVTFSGTVNGKRKTWTSPWQPTSLAVGRAESRWCIQDAIPADIAGAPDASAQVLISPFTADLLFLNKKQALKRSLFVKEAHLELLPAGAFPATDPHATLH